MNSYMYDDDFEDNEDCYEEYLIEEYFKYFNETENKYWSGRCADEYEARIQSGDWI